MTELSDLPPLQRAQRYLDLAADARRQAAMSNGAMRQSYLLVAEQWERLASELAAKPKSDQDQQKFSDFGADNFENLSLAERVRLCREMARRARAHAQSAPPSHRNAYFENERQWGELADDIERSGHPFSG